MQGDHFNKLLQQAALQEQQRQANQLADAQVKLMTVLFDKATAYTNLIILGAYAGFFGLWQITKEYLSKQQALWSALLMLISLLFFVLFEVVKMIVIQRNITAKATALRKPETKQSPTALAKVFGEIDQTHERVNYHFMHYWIFTTVVTVGAGIAATAVLCYAFIVGLLA
jgi:hypothetical protein